jgi:hypothetical protein
MMPFLRGLATNDRVLRGGAFNNNWNNARAAYRNNNHPDNRNNNVGLRVVVAHNSQIICSDDFSRPPLRDRQKFCASTDAQTRQKRELAGHAPGRLSAERKAGE